MLQISSSARQEIRRIQSNQQEPDRPLQLTINSGGCSGLFYDLQLATKDNDWSDRAELLQIDGIDVLVNKEAWKYLKNLKIDYAEDLMGGGFRFHNPEAKNVCGCGLSFTLVDDYKSHK